MKRRDLLVVRQGERFAFSVGALVEALQGAGVLTDDAIRIVRDAEKHFRASESREVGLEELVDYLARSVRQRVSSEAAQRFLAQTPPFVPLRVRKGEDHEVFSRRVLSQSLEKLELSFKEAYAVASQVEQSLRTEGHETVDESELAHVVALALEARYGRELRLKYEATVDQPADLYIVEPDGSQLPYSRGILARSVMSVGLGPELSYNLAKRVEDLLWKTGERRVPRTRVRSELSRLLREEAGEEFARRYELLHSLKQSEHPVIVLVGGAPGVGKSTVASELGYRLGIPRLVSTDAVRQALRSLISPELSPLLHASSYTAWQSELLPSERLAAQPTRNRVIRGFQAQVQQLSTAITAIIRRNNDENTSLVMEGIHLVPGISPRGTLGDAMVIELMLVVEDEENHRNHFGLRDQRTNHKREQEVYLQHFTEIRILQEYLVERAKAEGVPVIDATDFDHAVDKALEHVLASLLARRLPAATRERSGSAASGENVSP